MADYSDYKECTDCVYYELCLHQEKFLIEHNRKDLIRRYGFGLSEPEICCNFRDRSRFVELPCKLGDTLFVPTRNFISEYEIEYFHFGKYGIWFNTKLIKGISTRLRNAHIEAIGKDVFLTREEAEQALKERNSE